MATTHIPQEEVLRDLPALLARVHEGESFIIEDGETVLAVLQPPPPRQLTFRERLEALKDRDTRMGADFADDVEDGIRLHQGDRPNISAWDE